MRERFEIPIPMWRAMYQVRGGHPRVIGVAVMIAVAMGVGIYVLHRFTTPGEFARAVPVLVKLVMVVECVILLLGGSNAIHKAMLRDYETRMIDSHRLTPMSNVGVTLGYLIGPTFQILAAAGTLAVMGGLLASMVGMSIAGWAIGHLFVFNGVLAVWAFFVFVGMRLGKPVAPGGIIIAMGAASMFIIWIPGFGLLTGAYTMLLGFWLITGSSPVSVPALYAIAAVNLSLTAFWITTTATKYRRPDLPALNAERGMMLFVIWLLLATGGMVMFDYATSTTMRGLRDGDAILGQWLVTMIASLVIAVVPISGAVECSRLSRQGRALRGWSDRIGSLWIALLAGVLICAVMSRLGWSIQPEIVEWSVREAWAWSVTACVCACVTIRGLLELTSGWTRGRGLVTAFFILLLWFLPPVLDGARADLLGGRSGTTALSALLGCSPVGMILAVWLPLDIRLLPGAIAQGIIAVGLTVCVQLVRRPASHPHP